MNWSSGASFFGASSMTQYSVWGVLYSRLLLSGYFFSSMCIDFLFLCEVGVLSVDQSYVPSPMRAIQVDMQVLIKELLMQKGEFLSDYDAMYEACFRLLDDDKRYFDGFYKSFKERHPDEIFVIVEYLEKEDVWASEEWSMPASAKMPHKLKMREHVVKCLEYIAYKEVLFESYGSLCMIFGGFDLGRVGRVFKAMLTLHAKASQHLAAIHILKNHQQKSYDFRTQKGGSKKALSQSRTKLLCLAMVKHLLLAEPPRGREGVVSVADRYTKYLLELNDTFGFFASEKPDIICQFVLDALKELGFNKTGNHRTYFDRILRNNPFAYSDEKRPATLNEHGYYKAGVCRGMAFSIEEMVLHRFGEIAEGDKEKLKNATYHDLLICIDKFKDAKKMSDVFRHL